MNEENSLKMLKDFYQLHKSCQEAELDFEGEWDKKMADYPQVKKFYVDNNYFATSVIYCLPLSAHQVALCYVDQYSREIIRMNFSLGRLEKFVAGMHSVLKAINPEQE